MFNDARSKKLIITAHCLLNQNSISDGTADLPSQFVEIIHLLMAYQVGIIQLPCPEFSCLGLARGDEAGANRELLLENTRIRTLLEAEENRALLRMKARELAGNLVEYQKYGFQILGVLGINRSSSCGIETTTREGRESQGQGVFMKILAEELARQELPLKMVGIKTSRKEDSLENVRKLLAMQECG